MGADVDLRLKGDFCPVQSITQGSFLVRRRGEDVRVSADQGPVELRLKQTLKLTETSAAIDQLAMERVYTPANDPYRKFGREQPGTAPQQAATAALNQAIDAQAQSDSTQYWSETAKHYGASFINQAQASAVSAQSGAASATVAQQSGSNNAGEFAARLQAELDRQLFDAVEMTFVVSSDKPLADAYVVVSTFIHPPDTKPGTLQNWIYARALGAVGPTPQKVRFKHGGFPPGFTIERYQVHLYSRGEELATNLAAKRVELTFAEAFQYVCLNYVVSHKGATVRAAPVMGKLPSGWRQRLTAAQLAQPYFVRVARDGQPLGAFTDDACTQSVTDPYLASLVGEIRFTPALEQGRAVEGIARLRFADIQM